METYPWQLQQLEKSETYHKWVPLACRDFHLLKSYRECLNRSPPMGLEPYFFGNRPLDTVYMAGTVTDPKLIHFTPWMASLVFELDDGSGPTVQVVLRSPYRRDTENFNGRFVEVWGSISYYKGRNCYELRACSVAFPAANLAREIDIKYEAMQVREKVLMAPWTIPPPDNSDLGDPSGSMTLGNDPTQYVSLSRTNSVLAAHKQFSLLETIDSQPEGSEVKLIDPEHQRSQTVK